MSLSAKIFLGLFLGIATGLFFGEMVAFLEPMGEAFIQLLKMAVLPYIMVSVIAGLGSLSYREAGILFVRVGGILLLIWAVTLGVVLVLPFTFPSLESAQFFSTALIEKPAPFDFLQFIPANPFNSKANNVLPAVVLFSIAVGVALMGIEKKRTLIENLEILGDALTRIMRFVMQLTPLGVFAIAASASGTMRFEELGRLQVYVLAYIGAAFLMTFCVLPTLVTMFTPLRYRDILARTRDALVTGFATNSLLIVLPILTDQGRELLRKGGLSGEESEAAVGVIVPVSFNFPHAGKLLQLSFVLFAAWFTESAVSMAGYVSLMLSGLVSFFGKPVVAMPFLLDLVRVPADMFQFYLVAGIVAERFGTLVSVMQTFVLAVLGAFAMARLVRFRWQGFVGAMALNCCLILTFVVAARLYFGYALEDAYNKDQIISQMQLLRKQVPMSVHKSPPPTPIAHPQQSRLATIRKRGFLRVCYRSDNLPFTYFDSAGELVGFGVEMAHLLAQELNVSLEFVPGSRRTMARQLASGYCDTVVSVVVISPRRAEQMALSVPYMDLTLAFVVKDHRRDEFNSRDAVKSLTAPRIGVPNIPYYIDKMQQYLPQAIIVPLSSFKEFDEKKGDLDGFVASAEAGAAWSLIHPDYTVAVPHPDVVKLPVVYPLPRDAPLMLDFVDAWITVKKKDGTIARLYDYWILGKDAVKTEPRWSVIRNVLHWIE